MSTDVLYEIPRKLTINSGIRSQYNYKINREIYFNPIDSLGIRNNFWSWYWSYYIFFKSRSWNYSVFIPTQIHLHSKSSTIILEMN